MEQPDWKIILKDFYEEFGNQESIFEFNEQLKDARTAITGYAQLAIKSLFAINGGGLVALPAIVEAFNMPFTDCIFVAAIAYASGLVLAMLTLIMGYFSVSAFFESVASERNALYSQFSIRHMGKHYLPEVVETLKKQEDTFRKHEDRQRKTAGICEALGIVFCVFSLTAFIVGSTAFIVAPLDKTNSTAPSISSAGHPSPQSAEPPLLISPAPSENP